MDTQQAFNAPEEILKTRPVFSEPVHVDGVTIIPASVVRGGGASRGNDERGRRGFGLQARPYGAFVVKNGKVSWRPAIDVNRVIMGGQLVALAAVLSFGPLLRLWLGRRSSRWSGLRRRFL
jgi:hypothetical protein